MAQPGQLYVEKIMNKYTFILRRDTNVRINIDCENVTAAWLVLEQKLRRLYFNEGVALPIASFNWELVQ